MLAPAWAVFCTYSAVAATRMLAAVADAPVNNRKPQSRQTCLLSERWGTTSSRKCNSVSSINHGWQLLWEHVHAAGQIPMAGILWLSPCCSAKQLLLCTCCGMLLSLLGIQAGMTDQKKLLA